MKAVVIESKDRKSVILGSDGSFYTIRGTHRVGEEISYVPVKRYTMGAVSLVAAVMLFFSCFTIYDDNYRVYATVRIDGDAKIEYEINKKEEIIGIKAVDSESEDIVEELKKQKMDKKVHINEGLKKTKKLITKKNGRKAKARITVKANGNSKKSWKRTVINDIEKQEKHDKNTVVSGSSSASTSNSKQSGSSTSATENKNSGSSTANNGTGSNSSGTVTKTEDKEVKTDDKASEKDQSASDTSQSKTDVSETGDKTSQDKTPGTESDNNSGTVTDKDSENGSSNGTDKGTEPESSSGGGSESDAGRAPVDTGNSASGFQAEEDEAEDTAVTE